MHTDSQRNSNRIMTGMEIVMSVFHRQKKKISF